MWDAYLNGIRNHIPNAGVVFDRFHIMKLKNKAIEKVRWAEQKTNKDLKKTRFIWLKNPKNLTEKQAEKLCCLKKYDLNTARAYHIKLALARFWDIEDSKESEVYLKKWYFWATHSRLLYFFTVLKYCAKHLFSTPLSLTLTFYMIILLISM